MDGLSLASSNNHGWRVAVCIATARLITTCLICVRAVHLILLQKCDLRAQVGYKRRPGKYGTKSSIVIVNQLKQNFDVALPNMVWVTDITFIKTHEDWLFLSVVIDLYSSRVVGWSMSGRR